MRTNLTRATLRAVKQAPCSIRALAKAAGISHGLLHQIQRGHYHVSPEVAERLAAALEAWGATCVAAARRIRAAARKVHTIRSGRTR